MRPMQLRNGAILFQQEGNGDTEIKLDNRMGKNNIFNGVSINIFYFLKVLIILDIMRDRCLLFTFK